MAPDCPMCELVYALDYAESELARLDRDFNRYHSGALAPPDPAVVRRTTEALEKFREHPHLVGLAPGLG